MMIGLAMTAGFLLEFWKLSIDTASLICTPENRRHVRLDFVEPSMTGAARMLTPLGQWLRQIGDFTGLG